MSRTTGQPAADAGDRSPDDARWAAVCARAAIPEDPFVYAVKTTGVYCRAGCASRRPRRANVAFHDTPASAAAAGFRACLRCRPDQDGSASEALSAAIARACRVIETSQTAPSLAVLAAQAGLSPFHFQRKFKAAVGLTPASYARARRAERARVALRSSDDVTSAIYDSGFNSSGRFYETSNARLGMTPLAYKAGGRDQTLRYAVAPCWLGKVLAAATERGVCAITLGDGAEDLIADLERRFPHAALIPAGEDFQALLAKVLALIESPGAAIDLPLDIRGAAFQERVWQALARIPAGCTASYGDIAKAVGAPKAARAVARACASNAVAVAIPCHRVVGGDGALSGYRWGVQRKRALLAREKQAKP